MEISKETLQDIIDQLDFGMRCFVHKHTHEVVAFPDSSHPDKDDELWADEMEKLDDDFDNFKEIQIFSSSESFGIMAEFTDAIPDLSVKRRLIQALEVRKPFANFKQRIPQSGSFQKQRYAFKNARLRELV